MIKEIKRIKYRLLIKYFTVKQTKPTAIPPTIGDKNVLMLALNEILLLRFWITIKEINSFDDAVDKAAPTIP